MLDVTFEHYFPPQKRLYNPLFSIWLIILDVKSLDSWYVQDHKNVDQVIYNDEWCQLMGIIVFFTQFSWKLQILQNFLAHWVSKPYF